MSPQISPRAQEILPLVRELAALRLVGNPFGRDGTTPERIAQLWARLTGTVTTAELAGAVAAWLQDEEHGHQWPQASQLLRLCSAHRESSGAEAGTHDGPAGCELCGGTGTRTLCQHVKFEGKPVRIRTAVAACDTCERGRLLAASRGSSWRDVWARIAHPAARPEVEWVESYCTGSEHRYDPADHRPGSIFLSRLSPEEQHGPTPEAAEMRAAVEYAAQDHAWAVRRVRERLSEMGARRSRGNAS